MQHIETIGRQSEFKTYLANSPRIIFSAKFGDGKTQFLKEVALNEEFKEYQFFTIYPVNYVVAGNADIFEYVKRDILLQMAKANLLNSIDLNALITSFASFETFKEVLSFLVSCMPAGDFINKFIEKGLSIKEEYEKKEATLGKYNAFFTAMRGGIYEEDAYTQIVKEGLDYLRNRLKVEGGARKSVLVIEDLDRLDPGHLFRILNVISAHIDNQDYVDNNSKNKFGFDNVVLVMDYDATRHIFEHFYGKDASYYGYMSKFMSTEPFRYSLKDLALPILMNKLEQVLGSQVLKMWNGIIYPRLLQFSIRDIVRLYDFDYKSRIMQPSIIIGAYRFSTNLPIFRLLIYLTEIGVSFKEILSFGKKPINGSIKEMIELFYPVYLAANKMPDIYFDMGKNSETGESLVYGCSLSEYNGAVARISCCQAVAWGNSFKLFDDENLEEDLIAALSKLEEGVCFASLNKNHLC